MEKRHINIHIAGRPYPLSVSPEDEEVLRRVGKQIQDMIKDFEKEFEIRDKQDALAMCALRLGVSAELASHKNESIIQSSIEKIEKIKSMINNKNR